MASQCPTMCTIVLKGQNLYSSQDESPKESHSSSDSHSDISSKEKNHAYAKEGSFLMIQRLLNSHQNLPLNDQRENMFHTHREVSKKLCSLIINNGSCCNCCSTTMVEKLNLTLLPNPKPYKLHWLNEDGNLEGH